MDPLAQLQDIITPEPISQFPIAIGWWLLLSALIIALIIIFIMIKKQRARTKIQQQAIKQLKNSPLTINETITLIKWAAMSYFPRAEIANISGEKLAEYLSNKLPIKQQQQYLANTLLVWQSIYQKDVATQSDITFNQAHLLWLQQALPPEKVKTTSNNKGGQNDKL